MKIEGQNIKIVVFRIGGIGIAVLLSMKKKLLKVVECE